MICYILTFTHETDTRTHNSLTQSNNILLCMPRMILTFSCAHDEVYFVIHFLCTIPAIIQNFYYQKAWLLWGIGKRRNIDQMKLSSSLLFLLLLVFQFFLSSISDASYGQISFSICGNSFVSMLLPRVHLWIEEKNIVNWLTVNRRHHTDNHRMSRIRFPIGNRSMISVLLCACRIGGSLKMR